MDQKSTVKISYEIAADRFFLVFSLVETTKKSMYGNSSSFQIFMQNLLEFLLLLHP